MMQIHLNYLWYTVLPEKANKVGLSISIGTAVAVFYEKCRVDRIYVHKNRALLFLVMMQIHLSYLWSYELHCCAHCVSMQRRK